MCTVGSQSAHKICKCVYGSCNAVDVIILGICFRPPTAIVSMHVLICSKKMSKRLANGLSRVGLNGGFQKSQMSVTGEGR